MINAAQAVARSYLAKTAQITKTTRPQKPAKPRHYLIPFDDTLTQICTSAVDVLDHIFEELFARIAVHLDLLWIKLLIAWGFEQVAHSD